MSLVAIATWFSRPIIAFLLATAFSLERPARSDKPSERHNLDAGRRFLAPGVVCGPPRGAPHTFFKVGLVTALRIVALERIIDRAAHGQVHRFRNAFDEDSGIRDDAALSIEDNGNCDQSGEGHRAPCTRETGALVDQDATVEMDTAR